MDHVDTLERTRRLLLAEDSHTVRMALRTYLAAIPRLEVVEVEHGDAAIEQLRVGNIDIVLCDIEMPKRNGFEVLQMARKLYRA